MRPLYSTEEPTVPGGDLTPACTMLGSRIRDARSQGALWGFLGGCLVMLALMMVVGR